MICARRKRPKPFCPGGLGQSTLCRDAVCLFRSNWILSLAVLCCNGPIVPNEQWSIRSRFPIDLDFGGGERRIASSWLRSSEWEQVRRAQYMQECTGGVCHNFLAADVYRSTGRLRRRWALCILWLLPWAGRARMLRRGGRIRNSNAFSSSTTLVS